MPLSIACNGAAESEAAASKSEGGVKEIPQDTKSSTYVSQVVLTIDGMVCQGCAEAAKQNLESLPGVMEVRADIQDRTASVTFDPSETSVEHLVRAIEGLEREPAPAFRVVEREVLQ